MSSSWGGRVPYKIAPVLRRIWDQMPQPKWSIAMGACASSGGMFDSYAIVQGADAIVPVDVYTARAEIGAQRLRPLAAEGGLVDGDA